MPPAAILLFATISGVVLIPRPADAQYVPPIVLGERKVSVDPARIPFRPARVVYRQTEGEAFKKPAGVFVEPETGEVLVADNGKNLVTILTRDGVPLFSFGYNGEVIQPQKAVLDKLGRILVLAGSPRRLKVFSYRGEALGDFAFPGFEGAAQAVPVALTVDAQGNLYVADSTSGRILVYDPEDRLLRSFGKRGEKPGEFLSVAAIAVDPSGTIYVADTGHEPAVQIFDAQGIYLRGWGAHSGGPQNVSLPSGIAVDPSGRVFVVDTIRQTIAVFTSEGRYLFRFGGLGTRPGALGFPSDLAVDGAGRLYVTETSNLRLQIFEPASGGPAPPAVDRGGGTRAPRAREELRRGLNEVIKEMQK